MRHAGGGASLHRPPRALAAVRSRRTAAGRLVASLSRPPVPPEPLTSPVSQVRILRALVPSAPPAAVDALAALAAALQVATPRFDH